METANKKINIEISTNSILKVLLVLFVLWLLYLIRDVVAILFFVIILVSIFEPIVEWLQFKKIPKGLAVAMIYLVLLAIIALVIVLIIPPITEQVNQLSTSFPQYWERIKNESANLNIFLGQYGIDQAMGSSFEAIKANLAGTTSGLFSKVGNFFAGVFSLLLVAVITFYVLVEEKATKRILKSLVPARYLPYLYQLINKIQNKLGLWLRGQIILAFLIFLLVYIGLLLLGVKYALILAIIAGLLEFIPYLGPIFSGFIAVTLTLFHSPIQALLVLILYIVIQTLENHVLTPKIMQKTVGLNPVVSIVALLIGGKLGGIIGVILAIPVATALSVFVQDVIDKRKEEELVLEE